MPRVHRDAERVALRLVELQLGCDDRVPVRERAGEAVHLLPQHVVLDRPAPPISDVDVRQVVEAHLRVCEGEKRAREQKVLDTGTDIATHTHTHTHTNLVVRRAAFARERVRLPGLGILCRDGGVMRTVRLHDRRHLRGLSKPAELRERFDRNDTFAPKIRVVGQFALQTTEREGERERERERERECVCVCQRCVREK